MCQQSALDRSGKPASTDYAENTAISSARYAYVAKAALVSVLRKPRKVFGARKLHSHETRGKLNGTVSKPFLMKLSIGAWGTKRYRADAASVQSGDHDNEPNPMQNGALTRSFACYGSSIFEASTADDDSLSLGSKAMHERWESALKGRSVKELEPQQLHCLVQLGVPVKYRHQLWQQCFSETQMGTVEELQCCSPEEAARQIDLDVPRARTSWLDESDRSTLRRVLLAYAAQEPAVGYCQGMDALATVFIAVGLDEKAALRGMSTLLQDCCLDYFGPSLKGYVRDEAVLDVLVRTMLPPEISQRLDSLNLPLSTIAVDHFFTLGARTWPLGAVVRFWDLLLLKGSPASFALFLTLLQLYLPEEKSAARGGAQALEQVETFKQNVSNGAAEHMDLILDHTCDLLASLPKSRIDSLRNAFS